MNESHYELSVEEAVIVRVYAAGALTATEASELLAMFRRDAS